MILMQDNHSVTARSPIGFSMDANTYNMERPSEEVLITISNMKQCNIVLEYDVLWRQYFENFFSFRGMLMFFFLFIDLIYLQCFKVVHILSSSSNIWMPSICNFLSSANIWIPSICNFLGLVLDWCIYHIVL